MQFPKPEKRTSTKDWEVVRKELELRFFKVGIIRCELQLEDCTKDNFLGFAHRFKRKNIKTIEELEFCILSCTNCHNDIEYESDMYEIVTFIHDNRKIQP